ncbi:hypothetical protein [Flammeovirga sp. SJP92]|uniref:hypothetical protein n=1 Tax=Flammeovirga sp. SJP92 TaxID=1775430 RepID=UPI00078929A4|nr:hypothetical protein [Flammeovirga sp. SJP92]KXX68428.1 hypothetical protein AVL50_21915 [Flammeovirga sp. SJP92]
MKKLFIFFLLLYSHFAVSQNLELNIGDEAFKLTFSKVDDELERLGCVEIAGSCGNKFVITTGIRIDNRINLTPPEGSPYYKQDYFLIEGGATTVGVQFLGFKTFYLSHDVVMTSGIGDQFYFDLSAPTTFVYNRFNELIEVPCVRDNNGNIFNIFMVGTVLGSWDGHFHKFDLSIESIATLDEDKPQVLK